MDLTKSLGLQTSSNQLEAAEERKRIQLYINLKLHSSGLPACKSVDCDNDFFSIADDLLQSYREKSRLLSQHLCPADQRIQDFLDVYLEDSGSDNRPVLPSDTLILDQHGVSRELSLPVDGNYFESEFVKSYRVSQGVLHNTSRDRRTTAGSFHIAEGGLPIPWDKKAVPKIAYANLLHEALNPPKELLLLPFTSKQKSKASSFVSILLRPTICPEIPDKNADKAEAEKSMEIRFIAPGTLTSNLDFVESIFGNAGNPSLSENDAGLDIQHWVGHTGCVILAPHLVRMKKKDMGLPSFDNATDRQKADEMCWKHKDDLYNNGQPFKLTARDKKGVIVTIVADNYFGYCKKEVKTQISYSANLFGLAEEEHAGGALAFPRHNHGEEFGKDTRTKNMDYKFTEVLKKYGDIMELQEEGHAIDKNFPEVIYVPAEKLRMDLNEQTISWHIKGKAQTIKLKPGNIYMHPSGYKIAMEKHLKAPSWRIVGTDAEGTFCHKPSTVSGGGKSEISKAIDDAIIYGPLFVNNLEKSMEKIDEIFSYDYSNRYKVKFAPDYTGEAPRSPLSENRSLGSMIKMLTPSDEKFTVEYNEWLETISGSIKALAFLIKRFYRPSWGNDWKKYFSVDLIDGVQGHELKYQDRQLIMSYLRVGFDDGEAWRIYKMRQDYVVTEKVQMEDDITASVVIPARRLVNLPENNKHECVKLVKNCEYRLFQRPDDAIIKGFDKQTELEMALPDNFVANYQPLTPEDLSDLSEDQVEFDKYTSPMRRFLLDSLEQGKTAVSSAHPLMVNGAPSKNPRYLQLRTDLSNPLKKYVSVMGARMHRRAPLSEPICFPVDSVLTGRRNNPPDKKAGIRSLAVYNPIHYQELPELFMEFICSLTGKSPSTTGAGSEGALTKGPFNALFPTADINNALVSYILTDYSGFSSAAGYVGPHIKVNHDISLIIPEIWAQLKPEKRRPDYLVSKGQLEKLEDFEHEGKMVLASRLGYRITNLFVHGFFGKIFDNPSAVFDDRILRPETQNMADFVDGINNIVEAQEKVAQNYINDGSIEQACPPLKALITIMAYGEYEGKDVHHPEIRALFTRKALLKSDWYKNRLEVKQQRDITLWERHIDYLSNFLDLESHSDEARRLKISKQLKIAKKKLEQVSDTSYLKDLEGTLGADPL
ncbi:MAG: hypothetical protein KZQ83_06580 [gamma proteobacterium symbiont of Taylorina sp.]|nr:hypothetical protein [gamma proteobacterium symbiont of Taylorina sp.]